MTLGVETIFPGPYLCYHGEPVRADVQRAHDQVLDVVEHEGPFDGVIGFSQGAALAAAVIARHEEEKPSEELFKIAVFIAASMPFNLEGGEIRLSYDGRGSFSAIGIETPGPLPGDHETEFWQNDCRMATVISEFESRRPLIRRRHEPQEIDVLLRYHPSTYAQRLRIPTVHVIGTEDTYSQQGFDLAELCSSRKTQLVVHSGGHELPRDAVTVGKIGEAIQYAVDRTRLES